MDPIKRLKQLRSLAQEKADYIDNQLENLEKMLDKLGPLLNKKIVDNYLAELNVENGVVLTDLQNQRKAALIDRAYDTFMQQQGHKVVVKMIDDLYSVTGMNADYFSELEGMKIDRKEIEQIVNERLGLNTKGELKREGFMKGLLDDPAIKNDIKKYALDKTIGGTGYEDLRSGLQTMIEGDSERMGKFKQFYRNAAYDTYTRIDALNGKLYGDKLGLNYFIYAGTRRKSSRHFCIKRKGQVFSREEALKWKNLIGTTTTDDHGKRTPAGPIVSGEDIDTYNPFVDRGGYGCVDDIMWVSDEVAFSMRPDLRPSNSRTDEAKNNKEKNDQKKETTPTKSQSPKENTSLVKELKKLTEEMRHNLRTQLKEKITPKEYQSVKNYENGGLSAVHRDADPKDVHGSKATAEMIAKEFGAVVEVRNHTEKQGVKNPELLIDGKLADNKTPSHSGDDAYKSIVNPIKKRTQDAIKQGATEVVFVIEKRYSLKEIAEGVERAFEYKTDKGAKQIETIFLRYRDEGVTKVSRYQFEEGDYKKIITGGFIPE